MANPWMFFVLFSCAISTVESSTVVVDSPFGKIQGAKKLDENTGQSYLSFKGIPYAKPPVGDLRFAKPQPHPNIEDVFDASKDVRIFCPHPSLMNFNEKHFQEDCLILNIQTKDIHPSNSLKKVLVYIHGGGFIFGSSAHYDSKSFVITQDVIVVTINYRLGILGFLSTANEASPGNYGLWDQSLAIKWVKDNIRSFGGDPDDITVAGESAGGSSVGFQSLSPYSNGLFKKSYLQSGAASTLFARSIYAQSHALSIAKSIGCWENDVNDEIDIEESKTLIDCLRKVPFSAFSEYNDFTMNKRQFVPRVDGDFLPDVPTKLLQDDKYLESIRFFDRSYLIAINNNEKADTELVISPTKNAIFANQTSEKQKESAYKEFLADCKKICMISRLGEDAASDEDILSKIDDFYSRRLPEDKIAIDIETDLNYLIPALDHLAAVSRNETCNSYFLYFDHFPRFLRGKYRGSAHGLDLAYWFDMSLEEFGLVMNLDPEGEYAEEDAELKRLFSSIIGDFMKTGNPGLTLEKNISSSWPKYDMKTSHFLNFNSKPWIGSFLEKDKQDLWFNSVPSLIKKPHVHSEL